MTVRGNFASNSGDAVIVAAMDGIGIARVLSYQVQDAVAAGRLVPLLESCEPAPVALQAVYPGGRLLPVRVRAMLDFPAEQLRGRDFTKLSPAPARDVRPRRKR